MFVPKRIVHTVDTKEVLLVLPFLGPLSFEIRSRLQKCVKNFIPYISLKVVYQSVLIRRRVSNTRLKMQLLSDDGSLYGAMSELLNQLLCLGGCWILGHDKMQILGINE